MNHYKQNNYNSICFYLRIKYHICSFSYYPAYSCSLSSLFFSF
uniref:Uncharacterized protein n=1 Tax=Rhizophora mucronata TaxID=61149 RepID=A0A2P2QDQ9_RHIMU